MDVLVSIFTFGAERLLLECRTAVALLVLRPLVLRGALKCVDEITLQVRLMMSSDRSWFQPFLSIV